MFLACCRTCYDPESVSNLERRPVPCTMSSLHGINVDRVPYNCTFKINAMKGIGWFTGFSLCALAFAGAALFELTRQQNAGVVAVNESYGVWRTSSPPKLQLWPLDGLDVATFLICAVCLSLAGGAGIGGGAVLVPCFILIRGWPTSTAVAMSNVTVLGGSFANFICNINRRRANGSRTIDWELILMMEPTTIAGAILGAILNKLLPEYLTTYLLLAFITFMAWRLNQKGRQAYEKETQLFKAAKQAAKAAKVAAAAAAAEDGTAKPLLEQHSGSLTIRTSGSTEQQQRLGSSTSWSQIQGVNRGFFSGSFTQSFSRLSAPLLADFDGSSTTPRAAVGSWIRQQQQQQQIDEQSPLLPAAAAARSFDAGRDVPQWLPDILRTTSRHLLDLRSSSVLFQGDAIGDSISPIIALPLFPRFSDSSDDSAAAAAAADDDHIMEDLEAGYDHDLDQNDLRQPLLVAANASPKRTAVRSARDPDLDPDRDGDRDLHHSSSSGAAAAAISASQPLAQRSEPCLPLPHLITLLFLSAWVVVTDILQSNTVCGSWQYWLVTLSVLLPVVVILLTFRQILLRKYHHDDLAAESVLPDDDQLHWTPTTTLLYPAMCSTAGLIAGLFGIGGGVVKGPLMLELGVPPDVAAATSATMIMFTAASACVVYSRFGQVLLDYGIAMVVMGFVITLGSQLLTFVLIKMVGRRSVIIFMMVVLMLMASSIMMIKSVQETLILISDPSELTHFGRLCPTDGGNSCSGVIRLMSRLFQQ